MDIAVIGGGASGLTAAIAAARNGAHVTVFERNDKVGKKILVTGNGKCNISNMSLSEEYYYSEDRDFVVSAFNKFGLDDTLSFFKGLGLLLTEKRGGIYPYSEQASSVLDALKFEAESLGVKFDSDCFVREITSCVGNDLENVHYNVVYEKNIREINSVDNACNTSDKRGRTIGKTSGKNTKQSKALVVSVESLNALFDKVIVATGGKASPKSGSDGNGYRLVKKLGHSVTSTYPALIGLKCKGEFWKSISGVRCGAIVKLYADNTFIGEDLGELQLTDYGISGIPVFQISRLAAKALGEDKKVKAMVDFVPELSLEDVVSEGEFRFLLLSERTKEQFFNGFINKKLVLMLLKKLGMDADARICKEDILKFWKLAKNFEVDVIGDNGFDQAQVTAGGVPLNEINGNFESVLHKGLYIVGELLDVDGMCGGYNLQWAWTGGYIAGEAAAKC